MAERQSRTFEDKPAVREKSPLLIGLAGASGGGKTYSAMRLAAGIQEVVGGEVFVIDTDNGRALHYAEQFKFRHVRFDPPHSSLAYVDAIRFCVARGAGVIVVDGMSHEHEGVGGMLDFHEAELDRMAGDDWRKREAMKMLAWAKPKAARRALLLEIQRLMIPTVFCFRAKEGVKPVKVGTKTEVIQQGFTPIAGDEFVFEMTLNALLLPASGGVPTWNPEHPGEKKMTKLPAQFESLRSINAPIDEKLGRSLAKWATVGADRPETPRDQTQENRARQEPPQEDSQDGGPDGPDDLYAPPGEPESGQGGDADGFSTKGATDLPPEEDFPGDRKGTRAATAEEIRQNEAEAAKLEHAAKLAEEQRRANAEEAARRTAESVKTGNAPEPEEVDGFADFADVLTEADDWPQIVAGLKALSSSVSWEKAPYDRQMKARAAAYHRLRELNEKGYGLDFLTDPHAFRCYIEGEDDEPTLRLNFSAFKATPVWTALPEAARSTFATAAGRRSATLTAAGSGASDFT